MVISAVRCSKVCFRIFLRFDPAAFRHGVQKCGALRKAVQR